MPLALEPNETFEIVLDSDKNKPQESQPRFIYRHLTCRQWRQFVKFGDKLKELKNEAGEAGEAILDKMMDRIKEKATTNLVGWVNMIDLQGQPIPFALDKFEDIIGLDEANELIAKLENYRPSLEDKKKLDLQQDYNMAGSASIRAKNAETPANANTD